jgi:hypothetical protein
MKIEIKHRYTNEVIYSCEANSFKEAVEKAVKEKVNLIGSNLSNSDLSNSNLRGSENLDKTIKLPMYCKWSHGVTNGNLIQIGCEKRTIGEWDLFFNSDEKLSTERGTQEFKKIQAVFEAYKAYLNFLNK